MPHLSHVIFESNLLRIGRFCCQPDDPRFANTGPIVSGHLIVFPRTSVCITHAGGEPIIADPNVVMFYNQYQHYQRAPLSERGDLCEWFAFAPHVLTDALRTFDPMAAEQLDHPFRFTHGPSDAASYVQQRTVIEQILNDAPATSLYIEETMLQVLSNVMAQVQRVRGSTQRKTAPTTAHSHRTLTFAVREILSKEFRKPITLTQLAAAVHCSPFQLCRLFQRQTGVPIHRYLNQLRLRTALEAIAECNVDLTELALSLGYASHSHFTQAFRQTFGMPPSQLRSILRGHTKMSKNLIA